MKQVIDMIKLFWKPIIMMLIGLVIISQCSHISYLNEENTRLETNFEAVCDSTKVWKTKSGQLVNQTKNMEVTIRELEMLYGGAKNEVQDLKIKIKNLETYQRGVITKTIHDTIILRDTVLDNHIYKTGMMSDGCVNLAFTLRDTTMVIDLNETDIIDVFIVKTKEHSWWKFWMWPRKTIYITTATSTCPNTEVIINTCTIKK